MEGREWKGEGEVRKRMKRIGPIIWEEERPQVGGGEKASDVDEASRWLCSQQQLGRASFRFAFWDTTCHVTIEITTPNNASTPALNSRDVHHTTAVQYDCTVHYILVTELAVNS